MVNAGIVGQMAPWLTKDCLRSHFALYWQHQIMRHDHGQHDAEGQYHGKEAVTTAHQDKKNVYPPTAFSQWRSRRCSGGLMRYLAGVADITPVRRPCSPILADHRFLVNPHI